MSKILKALLKTILTILIVVLIGLGFYIIPWIMIGIWALLGVILLLIFFYLGEE